MDNDRDKLNSGTSGADDYTLESILAEYKGSAYIDGDRRTPSDILNAKTEEILREALGTVSNGSEEKAAAPSADSDETAVFRREVKPAEKVKPAPEVRAAAEEKNPADISDEPTIVVRSARDEPKQTDGSADDTRLFEGLKYADADATKRFARETEKRVEEGRLFRKKEPRRKESKDDVIPFDTFREPEPEIPEPDFDTEARRYRKKLRPLSLRFWVSAFVCLLMAIITVIADAGGTVPLIGANHTTVTGVLMIMQVIVMLLGLDVLASGLRDIFSVEPGAESLVLASCVITLIGGFVTLLAENGGVGIPFSLISACSLCAAIRGRQLWYYAMSSSLKAACASSAPHPVVPDDCIEDRTVLKKADGGTDGFYRKLTEADVSESAYSKAAPLLFLASIVFAVIASIGHGKSGDFAYAFAAMAAMAASFPASLGYSLPFSLAARSAKQSGGAVAGWGGACDIYESDGALITDIDIFPTGTVSITGVKLFEGVPQDDALRCTASLIMASGSSSAKAFAELLKAQRLSSLRVTGFECHEGGGISGTIQGKKVTVGSSAFMNLIGIRVPKGLETRGTVFTAVEGELIAVFTEEFSPANSVRGALVAMEKTRSGMVIAVRDFNVSPHMLEQKFRVSMKNAEVVSTDDCYRLSGGERSENAETVAVICREGLGPFAEIITKGRMLRLSALVSTAIAIAGAALGILFMYLMCSKEAFESASPTNAFVFMIAVQIVVSLLSRLAERTVK